MPIFSCNGHDGARNPNHVHLSGSFPTSRDIQLATIRAIRAMNPNARVHLTNTAIRVGFDKGGDAKWQLVNAIGDDAWWPQSPIE